ncbi:MAG: MATE family efflux transporter, partial [Clostridia bacterium]|nr:MATE family efflux transporter [Clostridia bacterium]
MGISTGANVLVARYYGSHEYDHLSNCVHCSIGLSGILGIIVGILGLVFST